MSLTAVPSSGPAVSALVIGNTDMRMCFSSASCTRTSQKTVSLKATNSGGYRTPLASSRPVSNQTIVSVPERPSAKASNAPEADESWMSPAKVTREGWASRSP